MLATPPLNLGTTDKHNKLKQSGEASDFADGGTNLGVVDAAEPKFVCCVSVNRCSVVYTLGVYAVILRRHDVMERLGESITRLSQARRRT